MVHGDWLVSKKNMFQLDVLQLPHVDDRRCGRFHPHVDVEDFRVVKSPTSLSYEDQIVVMGCGRIHTEGPGLKGP